MDNRNNKRKNLPEFVHDEFFHVLGLKHMYFDNTDGNARHKEHLCAATEYCAWRGGVIQGHVHDENAYALGGYSGHAGLFGTAQDICTLLNELLKIYYGSSNGLLKKMFLEHFYKTKPYSRINVGTWVGYPIFKKF